MGSSTGAALSIVAPCYDEGAGLRAFYDRVIAACSNSHVQDYEIILVDDGSHDNTWEVLEELAVTDHRLIGVRLMRNYGHQLASTAGLAVSRGHRVMLIDADLQDPPELLVDMLRLMDEGADVVYGKRTLRAGETWFKRASAAAFYRLAHLLKVPIPSDTGDFRLMNRRVVDILLAMPEQERFIRGMVSWIGGKQVPLLYQRCPRSTGKSKYSVIRMVNLAADAVTGFSSAPLRFSLWLGIGVGLIATLLLAYTLFEWFNGNTIRGWTSIMTVICLFAGVQLICIGIIGEYVGRLLKETKSRPLYIIDSIVARGQNSPVASDFSRLSHEGRQRALRRMLQGREI